jgi:hypothetical protein
MKLTANLLSVAAGLGLAGCVVVPTRHGPVLVGPRPVVVAPAPVVVAPAPPPPAAVEVVPASPYPGDPAYVWTPGAYFYDAYGVRHWHRGYWHHR